jgi:UDP-2,3-diacylglucosamine hydrolase
MTGLPDPTVLRPGAALLLSHGDALCLDDRPTRPSAQQVRASRLARPAFWPSRWRERLQIAAEIRHASRTRRQFDGDSSADVDAAKAVHWLHAMGAAELVHGHTHRPGSQTLAPGFKRHVLSDWDLDHAQRAEVLRLTRDGLERLAPPAA